MITTKKLQPFSRCLSFVKNVPALFLFTFLLIGCSSLYAARGSHDKQSRCLYGHKKPNVHQQLQQARHASQHLQKLNTSRSARFEKRHPIKKTSLSSSQRAGLVALTFMLLMPAVIATFPDELPMIKLVDYSYRPRPETFGPCATLRDNSTLCCDIGSNYTVTCCVHPSSLHDASRCISFDPGGIIGDEQNVSPNLKYLLESAEQTYDKEPTTYRIRDEARVLLQPKYLQGINGTSCSIETFDSDVPYPLGELFPDCTARASTVNQHGPSPSLFKMVKRLARTFNLSKMPTIEVINDIDKARCQSDGYTYQMEVIESVSAGLDRRVYFDACKSCATGTTDSVFQDCLVEACKKRNLTPTKITIPYSFLSSSDAELFCVLAHEFQHLVQCEYLFRYQNSLSDLTLLASLYLGDSEFNKTNNGCEPEADLGALLATKNANLAVWLKYQDLLIKYFKGLPLTVNLPTITRENAMEVLQGQSQDDDHPLPGNRISFILTMYEHYRRALKYLGVSYD